MRAPNLAALTLLFLVVAEATFALDPPDDATWQAGMTAARAALAAKDVAGLEKATVAVFEQSIRMTDRDVRAPQSQVLLGQALQAVEVLASRARVIALLEKLNDVTKVKGGLPNVAALTPSAALANVRMSQRDFAGARALMRDVAERATADFGPSHVVVRIARRQEADAAARMGDFEYAAERLSEVLDSTRRTFGATSPEYAEILVANAGLHAQREDYARAVASADEAFALVSQQPQVVVATLWELASIYEQAGQLAKARDLYQKGDLSADRSPTAGFAAVPVLTRLASLNATLGDGAAARTFMIRATDIALSLMEQAPELYVDALFTQASLYSQAGRYDRAVESINRVTQLLPRFGADQAREVRRRIAWAYVNAEQYDRALAIGGELLRVADPKSESYVDAAVLVALAGAQKIPPAPRTALAQSAVDLRRGLDPRREPEYELIALAMSYAAEGRWQESLDLQKRVIDYDISKRGPYDVTWRQWRTYATALEHVGRGPEAAEIRARVESERAPLAAALADGGTAAPASALEERNAFGFNVTLTNPQWRRWSGESVGWPMATFAAQYHPGPGLNEATLVVMPVLLPEGIDTDTAITGLLAYLDHDRRMLAPWSNGSLRGYEYRFNRTNLPGRPYSYVGRLLVADQRLYLIIADASANNPDAIAAAATALDQVSLAERPEPTRFNEADRKHHAAVLNNVATGLAGRRRFDDALALFAAARSFAPMEDLLQNIILVNLDAGHFEAARDEIDRYPGGAGAYPPLFLVRARCHMELGEAEAAIDDYRAGFAAGLRDDEAAAGYVRLLMDHGGGPQAVAFLDKYAAAKSTPPIVALQALASFRVGDDARLERALAALADPQRSSAEAVLVGALVHVKRGGVGELEQFVNELDARLVSPELYALLGATQLESRRLADARASVKLGLALAPENEELKALDAALKAEAGPVL